MASNYEKRKQKEEQIKVAIENVKEEVKDLVTLADGTAYDVYFDKPTRKWMRIDVEYNLLTGVGRIVKTKAIADSQPVATYLMNETVNRRILGLPQKD